MNEQREVEMTSRQSARVCRLIEKECCNCVDSICIMMDHGYGWYCPQLGTRILFCPWFKEAVLPMDRELQRELLEGAKGKMCEMCHRSFIPKSNRAVFCSVCARKNRKLKKTEWMRNARHSCGRLEPPQAAYGADFRT